MARKPRDIRQSRKSPPRTKPSPSGIIRSLRPKLLSPPGPDLNAAPVHAPIFLEMVLCTIVLGLPAPAFSRPRPEMGAHQDPEARKYGTARGLISLSLLTDLDYDSNTTP